jgi:hypothetical protein
MSSSSGGPHAIPFSLAARNNSENRRTCPELDAVLEVIRRSEFHRRSMCSLSLCVAPPSGLNSLGASSMSRPQFCSDGGRRGWMEAGCKTLETRVSSTARASSWLCLSLSPRDTPISAVYMHPCPTTTRFPTFSVARTAAGHC